MAKSRNKVLPQINSAERTLLFSIHQGFLFLFFVFLIAQYSRLGFPGGSKGEASACNTGDLGLIPGSGRSPGEGNGTPLQYSCLENPMDREAW